MIRDDPRPISGPTCGKLLVFHLLLLPSVFVLAGAVALVFVAFGLVMAHRTRDAGHIEAAARNLRGLFLVMIAGGLILALIHLNFILRSNYHPENHVVVLGGLAVAGVALLYRFATRHLFLAPLLTHRDWIARHGLASREPRLGTERFRRDTPILTGRGRAAVSVADELLKWTKLLEEGHVSPEEFQGARRRLLGAEA